MENIDIFTEDKICTYFVKGNSYILKKNHDLFENLNSEEKTQLFEQLWNTEFNARLDKKNTKHYSSLSFENEIDMFLFFLKIK